MELEDIEQLYRNRQSCRAFDGREVPADLVKRICAAALLAPSACNAQPWKLVAVLGEKRKEVAGCLQGLGMNKFASDAGALVAVCEGKSNLTAKLGGRMKNTDCTANDLGILTALVVMAAEAAGGSSCILGWRNEEKLREALGIRDPVRIPVVVALGYAKAGDPVRPKNRKPLEETFLLL